MKITNIVFDKKGKFVLSQKNLNKFYVDNSDFNIAQVENFDPQYTYSYINGEVVRGDLFVPTDEETKQIEEQAIKRKYQDPRRFEYPSLEEQLDKLFHDIDNGTLNKDGNFYAALKAVKNKYPKI